MTRSHTVRNALLVVLFAVVGGVGWYLFAHRGTKDARATADRGTMVTVLQEFKMSKLASAWETLTGRNPKQAVIENLRHFKALAETGEIPRSQGQPHGPRGLVGESKASAYGEKIPIPSGVRSKAS